MADLSTVWPAPAKLNRFLHIIGRRADGYHRLQTVFQFLDLCDYLRFSIRSDGLIRRSNGLAEVSTENDLAVRAALLLQRHCQVKQGAEIWIDKRLPVGAGLGGGSSDAATTLVALNYYWQTGLSLPELATLGFRLGADVPVFIHGQAAWAEGVGERLTPLPALDEPWFVVLIPSCSVATAQVFADPALTRDSEPLKMRAFIAATDRNDCQQVVARRYPQVAQALAWLSQFARARLTGTGGCVFAGFTKREQAEGVLVQLSALHHDFASGFISRGQNTSPLHHCMQRLTRAFE